MGKKRKNIGIIRTTTDQLAGFVDDGKQITVEGMARLNPLEDDTNMLIAAPRKRPKKEAQTEPKVSRLSKKERKRLQDIIHRKEKKEKRAELLQTLSQFQATEEEMKRFTSITEIYTQSFKNNAVHDSTTEWKTSTIKGSRKKTQQLGRPEEKDAETTDTDEMSTDEEVEAIMNENTERSCQSVDVKGGSEVGHNPIEESHTGTEQQGNVVTEIKQESQPSTDTSTLIKKEDSKPATFIPVHRTPNMQESRLKLPILAEEQIVMETINDNPVVIVCGETGSGKTTQVPQFLYEAGYAHGKGIIGVTEPRRVAAISMSKRVAAEMNLTDQEVSYQIRYEGNVTPSTRIKFLTDGVLLKEAQKDPLLSKYSVVIIDEAHERSVYTDILIGLLSIIVRQREKRGRPLKLIIMSATLRVEDFTSPTLFKSPKPPPLVKVDARQFPVTVHFNKKTTDDYVTEAYKKVCKIHRTLPEGGILVFVTGQQEVHTLTRKLRRMFPYMEGQATQKPAKRESRRERKNKQKEELQAKSDVTALPQVDLDSYSVLPQDDEEAEKEEDDQQEDDQQEDNSDVEAVGEDDDDEDMENEVRLKMGEEKPDSNNPLFVLPLYSLLSSQKQSKVFEPPPVGCRLCVVATNVAETSLTIPNIRYVVDTGKTKTKFYDKVTGVSTFRVTWVSQASADQRAGRAGRTGPGHCYRLYSSAVFSDFMKFSPPEITRRPVDDLVLQMKSMRIDKVANFPFPTPPDVEQIKAAETLLISLGALQSVKSLSSRFRALKKAKSPIISDLGMQMSAFPVAPRYAKMLLLARTYQVLPYVVALVAALSVEEIFVNNIQPGELGDNKEILKMYRERLSIFQSKLVGSFALLGDMMVLLTAVGACEAEGCSVGFCHQLGVRVKAMKEVRKLRLQLTNAASLVFQDETLVVDPKLPPPNEEQALALRKVVLGGLADHVARRNPAPAPDTDRAEVKKLKGSFQCMLLEDLVYIHPESVLYKNSQVEFVVYQSMMESSRLFMRGICSIEPEWLPELASSYCLLSRPLEDPSPRFDQRSGKVMCYRSGSFGRCNWEFPPTEMEYPESVDCFRWFARFLLEGEVFPALKSFKESLDLSPSTMVKSWAKLQPRTETFLKALVNRGICTRDSLREAWKAEPKFLQKEYLEWVKDNQHQAVVSQWPPLVS